jgi:hypothetical protein
MATSERSQSGRSGPQSGAGGVGDVIDLVKAYARQETVDPLKSLGRFVGFGLAGALLLGIGGILLLLALLRLLQNETGTALTGNLSWLPYVIVLVVCGLVAALSVSRIRAGGLDKGRR